MVSIDTSASSPLLFLTAWVTFPFWSYTEAMKLIKECDVELKDAEEKISKIVSKDGELKEFELTE